MKKMTASSRSVRRQQWLERIDSVLRGYGLEAAAGLAQQALTEGVEHPMLLNLAATAHYGQGRYEEAVRLLKRARAMAPNDPHVPNTLGACLQALGRAEPALQAYDAALRADPHLAAAHFNRGTLLQELTDVKGARAAYQRAVALDPTYVDALASLAWLDAQAGDTVSAKEHGERARALSSSNVLARMALASADLQRGNLAAATEQLAALGADPTVTRVNRSIVLGMSGDLLDAQDRPAEAFSAYQASNAELKTLNAARFETPGTNPLAHVRRLAAWFEAADPEPWSQPAPARPRAADPAAHIFLVGFPRSGTTLLENVLAAHPDVVSLEEKDCLESVSSVYLDSERGLERLARLSSGEAARQRDAYWSRVRSFGVEPRGRVFIDKMPLASVQLPVVAKLFPNAKVLFARRDPRDIVLSCFRRRFGMNPSMYQLLTLEGAAAFYDAVMRLAEIYRGLLPLPQHIVRYESLVEGFEETARAACRFAGLDWDEGLVDFAAKARARGISTPSAAQVARGLIREGQDAWRRYEVQMAPVLPILEPWVQKFGYETTVGSHENETDESKPASSDLRLQTRNLPFR